jgi:hypothetical protein
MKDSNAGTGNLRLNCRRMIGFCVNGTEFAGRSLQFAAKDADGSRRIECQSYPISGDPSDLQDDVISHVNPFTNFSTEHQHLKTPCPFEQRVNPMGSARRACGRVLRLARQIATPVPRLSSGHINNAEALKPDEFLGKNVGFAIFEFARSGQEMEPFFARQHLVSGRPSRIETGAVRYRAY